MKVPARKSKSFIDGIGESLGRMGFGAKEAEASVLGPSQPASSHAMSLGDKLFERGTNAYRENRFAAAELAFLAAQKAGDARPGFDISAALTETRKMIKAAKAKGFTGDSEPIK